MLRPAWRLFVGLISLGFVPAAWVVPCFAVLGVLAGLALALGQVSRATSYLSDQPEACVNCHVMRPQYASWRHSSHARVATCNDCHVPHQSLVGAYAFKARDGLYHSSVFTLRLEPQVIRMSRAAVPVVEGNCRRCHARTIEAVDALALGATAGSSSSAQSTVGHANRGTRLSHGGSRRCWDCHRDVPHGQARSLSASPSVMNPELPDVLSLPHGPRIGGRRPRSEPGAEP